MKRVLKWIVITAVAVVAILIVAVGALHLAGNSNLDNAPEVAVQPVAVPTDAAALERGGELASISSCNECHRPDFGGTPFIDEAPIGYVPAPNLTSGAGGVGASYSDDDWELAIRHGVARDGRRIVVMATDHYAHYGDDDLGKLIAYLKSVAPVDNDLGERVVAFPGTIIFGVLAGGWAVDRIDHEAVGGNAPAAADSTEYGEYLYNIASCASCHGENLAGNTDPSAPTGPNITLGGDLQNWTEEEFATALRTGIKPSGVAFSGEMPWISYDGMSDVELAALWTYITSVPALPGNTP